jgi:hypothetical protein
MGFGVSHRFSPQKGSVRPQGPVVRKLATWKGSLPLSRRKEKVLIEITAVLVCPSQPAGIRTGMGRYEELIEKPDGEGLTDDEAAKLGRLMAERRGEPYEGDAEDPPPDVEMRRVSAPEEEIEEELAEGGRGVSPA